MSVQVPTGAAGAGRLEELIAATGMEVPGRRPVTALKEEG
jgi:hypothetical protein